MLPEMRDKVAHTCSDCKFLIRIVGRDEVRPGCAAMLPVCRPGQEGSGGTEGGGCAQRGGQEGLKQVTGNCPAPPGLQGSFSRDEALQVNLFKK